MLREVFWITLSLLGLAGCASAPITPSRSQIPWHDEAFSYEASLVTVNQQELFRLDPELVQRLKAPALRDLSASQRLDHLMELLFGRNIGRFAYAEGHSTIATETWQRMRGDCLSLTVLTYAMARELGLMSEMQEVQVPVLFDRRDNFDFLNQHVNVLFRRSGPLSMVDGALLASNMIVDFEPQIGSRREGQLLSDSAILARYYNNIAAEHVAQDRPAAAYAHFKAAILLEPGYFASYGNLALLYRRAGLLADAEKLLRQAIALHDETTVPLLSLHQLLVAQGRTAEAAECARVLQSRRDSNPYYWIGLGLQQLKDGKFRQAISALEHAQSLTSGFAEVHGYLAVAYWQAGKAKQANEQLALLASLNREPAGVSVLREKFTPSALLDY